MISAPAQAHLTRQAQRLPLTVAFPETRTGQTGSYQRTGLVTYQGTNTHDPSHARTRTNPSRAHARTQLHARILLAHMHARNYTHTHESFSRTRTQLHAHTEGLRAANTDGLTSKRGRTARAQSRTDSPTNHARSPVGPAMRAARKKLDRTRTPRVLATHPSHPTSHTPYRATHPSHTPSGYRATHPFPTPSGYRATHPSLTPSGCRATHPSHPPSCIFSGFLRWSPVWVGRQCSADTPSRISSFPARPAAPK